MASLRFFSLRKKPSSSFSPAGHHWEVQITPNITILFNSIMNSKQNAQGVSVHLIPVDHLPKGCQRPGYYVT